MKKEEYQQLTIDELNYELQNGGRFVIYAWTLSFLILTQKRPSSDVYFLRKDEYAIKHGWPYLIASLFLGWWGIPWGPIYTIQSIFYAFTGKDVTQEVIDNWNGASKDNNG